MKAIAHIIGTNILEHKVEVFMECELGFIEQRDNNVSIKHAHGDTYDMYDVTLFELILPSSVTTIPVVDKRDNSSQSGFPDVIPEWYDDAKFFPLFDSSIVNLDLSVRAINCLKTLLSPDGVSVVTVGDLCRIKKTDLFDARSMGHKTINEISDVLKDHGLQFEMPVDYIYALHREVWRRIGLAEQHEASNEPMRSVECNDATGRVD